LPKSLNRAKGCVGGHNGDVKSEESTICASLAAGRKTNAEVLVKKVSKAQRKAGSETRIPCTVIPMITSVTPESKLRWIILDPCGNESEYGGH
jgi:hypothetical protein